MNLSTAIMLINSDIRAVMGIYEAEETGKAPPPRTMFLTLDQSIKVGDFALVPTSTRHKMSVNKIVAVDVEVDFDSPIEVKWVVGKIDTAPYERVMGMVENAKSIIVSAEKRKRQDALRDSLLKDNPGLASLPIAGAASLAPPAPPEPLPYEAVLAPSGLDDIVF